MVRKYVRKDDRHGRYTDRQRAAYWKKMYLDCKNEFQRFRRSR